MSSKECQDFEFCIFVMPNMLVEGLNLCVARMYQCFAKKKLDQLLFVSFIKPSASKQYLSEIVW